MWMRKLRIRITAVRALAAFLVPLLPLVAGGPLSADHHVDCASTGMKKITVLGSSPVSSKPLESREAMADYLGSIRPAIESIMARKGMSNRTDELLDALRSGDGVSESELRPGDVLEWMIFRVNGRVGVGPGPYCVATSRSYPAFQVDLVDQEDLGDSVRETTTTFVIPKICANVALVGSKTETMAKPDERSAMEPPAAPAAPTPPTPPAAPEPSETPDTMAEEPAGEPGAAQDSRWTLRGFPLRLNVDDDEDATDDGFERTHVTLDNGNGVGLSLEYRPNPRLGIEGGLLYSELDSMFVYDSPTEWLMDSDSSSLLVLTLGPNFHLTPDSKADFYLGPYIGLAQIGDADYSLGGTVGTVGTDFDDEFVFGAQLGFDYPFGDSSWALHLGALYMNLGLSNGGIDLDANPLIGTIGLAYDF